MKARRQARCIALETLYEYDIAQHPLGEILQRRLDEADLSKQGVLFSSELVRGVVEAQERIDQLIVDNAPEWPLDQVAIIDRNILRISIFEFLISADTPVKVAINEAVELAKLYGSDSAPRFVNGVLGAITMNVPIVVENKPLEPSEDDLSVEV